VEYQSQHTTPKVADDLSNPAEWTSADLPSIFHITETDMWSVEKSMESVPSIDEAIQDIEKSLKKSIPNTT
jgi:hypothetical protein